MVNVTLYSNTGFDEINIPYSADLITAHGVTTESMDILQTWPIKSFRISAGDLAVETAQSFDYARLSANNQRTVWYFVDSVTYVAPDVIECSVTPDYVTTLGIANLTILAGLTKRRTVASSEDTFGAFTQEDELLGCNQPLVMSTTAWQDVGTETNKYVESTVDLFKLGGDNTDGVTFKDSEGNKCTVPKTSKPGTVTKFSMGGIGNDSAQFDNGTTLYIIEGNIPATATGTKFVEQGMQTARNIGSESAIISQYEVPQKMAGTGSVRKDTNAVETLIGYGQYYDTGVPFVWANGLHNNRVLYGSNCQYGILSVAGNKSEFKPEDIKAGDQAAPRVHMIADPRPDGCPYFRFEYYLGSSSNFWLNAIKGEGWRQVPLIYYQKSGNLQDQYQFYSEKAIEKKQLDYSNYNTRRDTTHNLVNQGVGMVGSVLGAFKDPSKITDVISGGANMLYTSQVASDSIEQANDMFRTRKQQEQNALNISMNSVAPSISLAPSAGALRDFIGNTFLVYRYHPTMTDANRLDHILGVYGYKDTKVLERADFNRRSNFSYVEASGVSIGGTAPRWLRNGVARMLENGVRVWKVQPSPIAWTTNV